MVTSRSTVRRGSVRRGRVRRTAASSVGVVALLVGSVLSPGPVAAANPELAYRPDSLRAAGSPLAPPSATPTCTAPGPGTRHCDLWATAGTVDLPGAGGLPVWGFTDTATGAPGLVGPTLVVAAGERVVITLHDALAAPVSLDIADAADLTPVSDAAGAAAGGSKDYSFTAAAPGTYLYQAGPTPGQRQQLAMGLVGALVVRPATAGQASDDPSTAFTDEAVLVLSDVDPRLNRSANPGGYDMRTFTPTYRLINGQAYPRTDPITAMAGGHLLLREVNAGSQDHALALFGPHQRVVSDDSGALPPTQQYAVAAETIAAGQTLDTIVDVPATAPSGLTYALADSGGQLFNPQGATPSASVAFGGQLTFVTVTGIAPPPVCHPGIASATARPAAIGPTESAALTATAGPCPGTPVTDVSYSDGAAGPWVPMTLTASTASASLTGLSPGAHTIYVRASDANGPGVAASVAVYVDASGPGTGGLSVAPDPHRSAAGAVTVRATGDDRATGGAAVTAAEAFDGGVSSGTPTPPTAAPGSGTALAVSSGGGTPVVGFSGSLAVSGTNGVHTIWVRSKDARGNWGPFASVTLTEDNQAPTVTGTSTVSPNPTNGKVGVNAQTPAVRVKVTFTDPQSQSRIAGMTGWVDTRTGSGQVFLAQDGVWNTATETGQLDIPLSTVAALANGVHTVLVAATDAAGNSSTVVSVPFTVDKTAPTFTSLNSTTANGIRTLVAAGADNLAVTGAEYWTTATDPGQGRGTQVALTGGSPWSFRVGTAAIYRVRLRDAAGNWSGVLTKQVP